MPSIAGNDLAAIDHQPKAEIADLAPCEETRTAAAGFAALGPFRGVLPTASGAPQNLKRLVVVNMFGGCDTLNMLIQNRLEDLAERVDLKELWFYDAGTIGFGGSKFCLTGKFVFGSPGLCRSAIEQRGGVVTAAVGDDTNFLVVGGLGLDEWRSGGLGAEIEKAMRLRATGTPVKIIPEDALVAQFR